MSTLGEDLNAWISEHVEAARASGWHVYEDTRQPGVPKLSTWDRYPARSQFKNIPNVWDYVLTVDCKSECWAALQLLAKHDPVLFVVYARDCKYTLSPRVQALRVAAELRL